ncbi:hypothetical protein Btru_012751 [Bulinus truncatus]|nr:hypothetical protein Btru_012751 [Bulinus truncatus]
MQQDGQGQSLRFNGAPPSLRDSNMAVNVTFYDPDLRIPRRPLAPHRIYHFNVIYNHGAGHDLTADMELALGVTRALVSRLELQGYVNSYYHDRDFRRLNTRETELERVLRGSSVTVLILTPEFLSRWRQLCSSSVLFSRLLGKPRPERRLLCLSVGVGRSLVPADLSDDDVLYFGRDWQLDLPVWNRVDSTLETLSSRSDDLFKVDSLYYDDDPEFCPAEVSQDSHCCSSSRSHRLDLSDFDLGTDHLTWNTVGCPEQGSESPDIETNTFEYENILELSRTNSSACSTCLNMSDDEVEVQSCKDRGQLVDNIFTERDDRRWCPELHNDDIDHKKKLPRQRCFISDSDSELNSTLDVTTSTHSCFCSRLRKNGFDWQCSHFSQRISDHLCNRTRSNHSDYFIFSDCEDSELDIYGDVCGQSSEALIQTELSGGKSSCQWDHHSLLSTSNWSGLSDRWSQGGQYTAKVNETSGEYNPDTDDSVPPYTTLRVGSPDVAMGSLVCDDLDRWTCAEKWNKWTRGLDVFSELPQVEQRSSPAGINTKSTANGGHCVMDINDSTKSLSGQSDNRKSGWYEKWTDDEKTYRWTSFGDKVDKSNELFSSKNYSSNLSTHTSRSFTESPITHSDTLVTRGKQSSLTGSNSYHRHLFERGTPLIRIEDSSKSNSFGNVHKSRLLSSSNRVMEKRECTRNENDCGISFLKGMGSRNIQTQESYQSNITDPRATHNGRETYREKAIMPRENAEIAARTEVSYGDYRCAERVHKRASRPTRTSLQETTREKSSAYDDVHGDLTSFNRGRTACLPHGYAGRRYQSTRITKSSSSCSPYMTMAHHTSVGSANFDHSVSSHFTPVSLKAFPPKCQDYSTKDHYETYADVTSEQPIRDNDTLFTSQNLALRRFTCDDHSISPHIQKPVSNENRKTLLNLDSTPLLGSSPAPTNTYVSRDISDFSSSIKANNCDSEFYRECKAMLTFTGLPIVKSDSSAIGEIPIRSEYEKCGNYHELPEFDAQWQDVVVSAIPKSPSVQERDSDNVTCSGKASPLSVANHDHYTLDGDKTIHDHSTLAVHNTLCVYDAIAVGDSHDALADHDILSGDKMPNDYYSVADRDTIAGDKIQNGHNTLADHNTPVEHYTLSDHYTLYDSEDHAKVQTASGFESELNCTTSGLIGLKCPMENIVANDMAALMSSDPSLKPLTCLASDAIARNEFHNKTERLDTTSSNSGLQKGEVNMGRDVTRKSDQVESLNAFNSNHCTSGFNDPDQLNDLQHRMDGGILSRDPVNTPYMYNIDSFGSGRIASSVHTSMNSQTVSGNVVSSPMNIEELHGVNDTVPYNKGVNQDCRINHCPDNADDDENMGKTLLSSAYIIPVETQVSEFKPNDRVVTNHTIVSVGMLSSLGTTCEIGDKTCHGDMRNVQSDGTTVAEDVNIVTCGSTVFQGDVEVISTDIATLIEIKKDINEETVIKDEIINEIMIKKDTNYENITCKDINDETIKEDINEETVKEDINEETVKKDINEETVKEDINEETIKEDIKQETIKEEINEGTVKEDINEESVKEDINEGIVKEDIHEETVKEGINEETIKEDINKETVKEDINEETVKEDINEETVKEDINEGTVKEDINEETIKEDINEETVKEDINEETVKEDINEETVKEDINEETIKEDINEGTVKEDINEETVKEDVNEETVKEDINEETVKEDIKQETIKEEINEGTVQEDINEESVKEDINLGTVKDDSNEEAVKEDINEDTVRREYINVNLNKDTVTGENIGIDNLVKDLNTHISIYEEIDTYFVKDADIDTNIVTDKESDTHFVKDEDINTHIVTNEEIDTNIVAEEEIDTNIVTDKKIDTNIVTEEEIDTNIETDKKIDTHIVTEEEIDTNIVTDKKIDTHIVTNEEINKHNRTDEVIDTCDVKDGEKYSDTILKDKINQHIMTEDDVIVTDEQMGHVIVTDEQLDQVIVTDEQVDQVIVTDEQMDQVIVTDEQMDQVLGTDEQMDPVIVTDEQMIPVIVTDEQMIPVIVTDEQMGPVIVTDEQMGPVLKTGEQMDQVIVTDEQLDLNTVTMYDISIDIVAEIEEAKHATVLKGDIDQCSATKTVTSDEILIKGESSHHTGREETVVSEHISNDPVTGGEVNYVAVTGDEFDSYMSSNTEVNNTNQNTDYVNKQNVEGKEYHVHNVNNGEINKTSLTYEENNSDNPVLEDEIKECVIDVNVSQELDAETMSQLMDGEELKDQAVGRFEQSTVTYIGGSQKVKVGGKGPSLFDDRTAKNSQWENGIASIVSDDANVANDDMTHEINQAETVTTVGVFRDDTTMTSENINVTKEDTVIVEISQMNIVSGETGQVSMGGGDNNITGEVNQSRTDICKDSNLETVGIQAESVTLEYINKEEQVTLEDINQEEQVTLEDINQEEQVTLEDINQEEQVTLEDINQEEQVTLEDINKEENVTLEDINKEEQVTLEDINKEEQMTLEDINKEENVTLENINQEEEVTLEDINKEKQVTLEDINKEEQVTLEYINKEEQVTLEDISKEENVTLEDINKEEHVTLEAINKEQMALEDINKEHVTLEYINKEEQMPLEDKNKEENVTLENINQEEYVTLEDINKEENVTLGYINKKEQVTLEDINKEEQVTLEDINKEENVTLENINKEEQVTLEDINKEEQVTLEDINKEEQMTLEDINKEENVTLENINQEEEVTLEDINKEKQVTLEDINQEEQVTLEDINQEEQVTLEDINKEENVTLENINKEEQVTLEDINKEENVTLEYINKEEQMTLEDINKEEQVTLEDINKEEQVTLEDINKEEQVTLEDISKEENVTLEDINKEEHVTLEDINKEEHVTLEEINKEQVALEDINKEHVTLEYINKEEQMTLEDKNKEENVTLENINQEEHVTLEDINKEENVTLGYINKKEQVTLEDINKEEQVTLEDINKEENVTLENINKEEQVTLEDINKEEQVTLEDINKEEQMTLEDINKEENVTLENINQEEEVTLEDINKEKQVTLEDINQEEQVTLEDINQEEQVTLEDINKEENVTLEDINKEEHVTLEDINKEEHVTLEEINKEQVALEDINKEHVTLEYINKEVHVTLEDINKKEQVTLEDINKEQVALEDINKEHVTLEDINKEVHVTLEDINKEVHVTLEDINKEEQVTLEDINKEEPVTIGDINKQETEAVDHKEEQVALADVNQSDIIVLEDTNHDRPVTLEEKNHEKIVMIDDVVKRKDGNQELLTTDSFIQVPLTRGVIEHMSDDFVREPMKKEDVEVKNLTSDVISRIPSKTEEFDQETLTPVDTIYVSSIKEDFEQEISATDDRVSGDRLTPAHEIKSLTEVNAPKVRITRKLVLTDSTMSMGVAAGDNVGGAERKLDETSLLKRTSFQKINEVCAREITTTLAADDDVFENTSIKEIIYGENMFQNFDERCSVEKKTPDFNQDFISCTNENVTNESSNKPDIYGETDEDEARYQVDSYILHTQWVNQDRYVQTDPEAEADDTRSRFPNDQLQIAKEDGFTQTESYDEYLNESRFNVIQSSYGGTPTTSSTFLAFETLHLNTTDQHIQTDQHVQKDDMISKMDRFTQTELTGHFTKEDQPVGTRTFYSDLPAVDAESLATELLGQDNIDGSRGTQDGQILAGAEGVSITSMAPDETVNISETRTASDWILPLYKGCVSSAERFYFFFSFKYVMLFLREFLIICKLLCVSIWENHLFKYITMHLVLARIYIFTIIKHFTSLKSE